MTPEPELTDYAITEAMLRYGGGFVADLGALFRRADAVNQAILKAAFAKVWAEYAEIARLGEGTVTPDPMVRMLVLLSEVVLRLDAILARLDVLEANQRDRDEDGPLICPHCGSSHWTYRGEISVCVDCGK